MPTAAAPQTDVLDHKRLLKVLSDYKRGDFSVRMPVDRTGLAGKICDALNEAIERNQRLTSELQRLSTVVGKGGNIKQRASLPNAEGDWAVAVDSVNTLVSDLVQPTTEVARVIGAVAKGDLSQSMALEIDGRPLTGEFLRTAKVVNTMVDQLGTFASEVTRVAREVGTEGKLGGQAVVKGVAGTWKDLTDNVNFMAANLTSQVRNIADVTTAVANGDLSKKITVDVKGEILALKDTINTMVDQLSSFASEVTRVAKEVGTEGKLGGQAEVKGVAGTWRDLTDNVNQLAGNLTVQLRDVSKVATAIAERRSLEENHRRCARRDPADQGRHQHDGRSARIVRLRGDARRQGSRQRRRARRPGRSHGRRRHLEGPDRQRQRDGAQPDQSGAQHRRGDHGRRARRSVEEDHRRRPRRDPRAEEHHQHDGRSAQLVRVRSRRASPKRWATKASWAGRPRSRASPARGAISPTTSTSWPAT